MHEVPVAGTYLWAEMSLQIRAAAVLLSGYRVARRMKRRGTFDPATFRLLLQI